MKQIYQINGSNLMDLIYGATDVDVCIEMCELRLHWNKPNIKYMAYGQLHRRRAATLVQKHQLPMTLNVMPNLTATASQPKLSASKTLLYYAVKV